jgi:hypothetical protein
MNEYSVKGGIYSLININLCQHMVFLPKITQININCPSKGWDSNADQDVIYPEILLL